MNRKERFFATIERKSVDYPASWLGMPASSSHQRLFNYFKVSNISDLKAKIGDDIWPMDVPYNNPPSNHIACAFDFAKDRKMNYETRTLTTPGFFEDYTDPSRIDDFNWPDPSQHIDPQECKRIVEDIPSDYAILGIMWSAHFQDTCAAFGMEKALTNLIVLPEMFEAVIRRITEFYLEANEIFYEATKGKLDAVLIGNDFGGQQGLMISPRHLRKYVFPTQKLLINQAKSYGLKVIFHSCGSIYEIIPDLIMMGVDAIHPIQSLAQRMDPDRLKTEFGDKVSFCGGVDVQQLMVSGSPLDIQKAVHKLKEIFPTGLIISPSHEAILPDVNPMNVEALFTAVKL
ncbi:MAG TPA: uroporphyrinogen decarboxylase family protein [Candidatus Deferrimicrobium sp.]|nr:uroporphyrinogen decarboxylase family protein [Candidatus Deferrimicrobium sp.]